MRQDAYECVCLLQTILNNGKFTKYPVRFKGESNGNLSEDFAISIDSAICIALSKQDDYCRSRPQKRQLCNYYFIIIDQVDILFGDRLTVTIHGGDINIHASRNLYTEESCIAESCIAESCIAGIMHSGIMHRGIMHRGNHASRVINYA